MKCGCRLIKAVLYSFAAEAASRRASQFRVTTLVSCAARAPSLFYYPADSAVLTTTHTGSQARTVVRRMARTNYVSGVSYIRFLHTHYFAFVVATEFPISRFPPRRGCPAVTNPTDLRRQCTVSQVKPPVDDVVLCSIYLL